MPIAHIQSSEDKKTQKASYKRRRNQNSEITQLEALLPWSQKGSGIDKISVLRLTSSYLRFKNFWQSAYGDAVIDSQDPSGGFRRLFSEALDGFILILASNGEIVFVSEGIADSVGISQQDVMGVSIYELTHEDDASAIQDSLKPNGPQLQQSRHFYVRFKTSITPGKKQLSKFGGTVMLQVSGKLKLSHDKTQKEELVVSGLVAECRRIESSSSILELRVPQTVFTSTTTMDLKILSLDTKMKTVTGFGTDVEGSVLTDFFHPSDNRRSIHCLKTLLITGQASSPIIRFMTHTGEWVWVQIQGLIRYEPDNRTPKYLEATFKVICASNGSLKMIEQTELYGKPTGPIEDSNDIHADPRFNIPAQPKITSPDAVIRSVEEANISEAVRDVLLHGRETALASIPTSLDRLATWPEVKDAVVEYETSQGLPANFNSPYPQPDKVAKSINIPEAVQSPLSSSSSSNSPSSCLSDLTPSASPSSSHVTSNVASPINGELFKNSPATSSSPAEIKNDDALLSLLEEVNSPSSGSNQPSPACSYINNKTPTNSYYTPSPVPDPSYMLPSPPSLQGGGMYYSASGGSLLTPQGYPIQLPINGSIMTNGDNLPPSTMCMPPYHPPPLVHMPPDFTTPTTATATNAMPYPNTLNGLYVANPYHINGMYEVNVPPPQSGFNPYTMSNDLIHQQHVLNMHPNF